MSTIESKPSNNSEIGIDKTYLEVDAILTTLETVGEAFKIPSAVEIAQDVGKKADLYSTVDALFDSSDSFFATTAGMAVAGSLSLTPIPPQIKAAISFFAGQFTTDSIKETLQTHQPDPTQIEGYHLYEGNWYKSGTSAGIAGTDFYAPGHPVLSDTKITELNQKKAYIEQHLFARDDDGNQYVMNRETGSTIVRNSDSGSILILGSDGAILKAEQNGLSTLINQDQNGNWQQQTLSESLEPIEGSLTSISPEDINALFSTPGEDVPNLTTENLQGIEDSPHNPLDPEQDGVGVLEEDASNFETADIDTIDNTYGTDTTSVEDYNEQLKQSEQVQNDAWDEEVDLRFDMAEDSFNHLNQNSQDNTQTQTLPDSEQQNWDEHADVVLDDMENQEFIDESLADIEQETTQEAYDQAWEEEADLRLDQIEDEFKSLDKESVVPPIQNTLATQASSAGFKQWFNLTVQEDWNDEQWEKQLIGSTIDTTASGIQELIISDGASFEELSSTFQGNLQSSGSSLVAGYIVNDALGIEFGSDLGGQVMSTVVGHTSSSAVQAAYTAATSTTSFSDAFVGAFSSSSNATSTEDLLKYAA